MTKFTERCKHLKKGQEKTLNGMDLFLLACDAKANNYFSFFINEAWPKLTILISCCCFTAGGIGSKFKWLISWPLLLLLFFTVPNCAKPRWEKYFMLSFILSTVWIAVFSYFMVWMVSVIFVCQRSFAKHKVKHFNFA